MPKGFPHFPHLDLEAMQVLSQISVRHSQIVGPFFGPSLCFFLSYSSFSCQRPISLCWGCSTYLCTSAASHVSLLYLGAVSHVVSLISNVQDVTLVLMSPSEEPTRQSQHIRCPSYRPRTTWRLPEIVSVSLALSSKYPSDLADFNLYLQRIPPTSFMNERPPSHSHSVYLSCSYCHHYQQTYILLLRTVMCISLGLSSDCHKCHAYHLTNWTTPVLSS